MEGIQIRKKENGEKRYRAHISKKINGKEEFISRTFSNLRLAEKWRRETLCAIEDGSFMKNAKTSNYTFGDVIDRYERDVLPNKPRAKQEQQLRWWREQLSSYSLPDITSALITEKRDLLVQTVTRYGKKMAATSVLRYLALLSHICSMCIQWELLNENPVKRIAKPKIGSLRARYLNEDECRKLLHASKNSKNPYLYPIVVLAIATGMRKSEILTLQISSLDFINGRILLEHTKNGERRAVSLKGFPLEVMKEFIQQKIPNKKFLFPSKNGAKPLDMRKPWETALAEASIENFKFHDLRHSAASFLLMTGATLAETAEVLGHKTLALVKRYGHLSESHVSNVLSRMNDKVFGK